MKKQDLFEAIDSFDAGHGVIVHAGDIVEAGHPILKGREGLFKPLEVKFAVEHPDRPTIERPIEAATAAPGEKR